MFSKSVFRFKSILSVAAIVAAASLPSLVGAAVKDEIANRTSPVGKICMSGDSCAAAPIVVASGPRSGEDIYNASCLACHNTGAAGAPKLGDVAAWAPRIDQGAETLYTHAIAGFNSMPAKGLCMTCSDDDIKASVDYMVTNSK
ncbi:MAG: cytochrome c5 [Cellvibrionaceae bacterium]